MCSSGCVLWNCISKLINTCLYYECVLDFDFVAYVWYYSNLLVLLLKKAGALYWLRYSGSSLRIYHIIGDLDKYFDETDESKYACTEFWLSMIFSFSKSGTEGGSREPK